MAQPDLAPILEDLAGVWRAPVLTQDTTVEFSTRMTKSLGRCVPGRHVIRLRDDLRDGPAELIREVLCHEAAHIVAHERWGADAAPHGPEWRALVTEAGYAPRRLYPRGHPPPAVPSASPREPNWYEHRCPVCQAVQFRKTPAQRWYCVECRENGLEGNLEVRPVTDT